MKYFLLKIILLAAVFGISGVSAQTNLVKNGNFEDTVPYAYHPGIPTAAEWPAPYDHTLMNFGDHTALTYCYVLLSFS